MLHKINTETSRHHVWWERQDYKKHHERSFRRHSGFIIPKVPNGVHRYLHAIIEPPEKPTRYEMEGVLRLVEERESWDSGNPYWAMEAAMSFFVGREVESPADAEHCRAIRYNLAQQIGVLANSHTDLNPVTHTLHLPATAA